MTVTIVTRWTTANVAGSTEIAKRSKALWIKNGAQDVRLSQIYTGEFTGHYIMSVLFADMATYAKASAAISTEPAFQANLAENAKLGAVMHERMFLMGVDL